MHSVRDRKGIWNAMQAVVGIRVQWKSCRNTCNVLHELSCNNVSRHV